MAWDVYLFHLINDFAGRFGGLDALGVFAAVFLLPLMAFLLIPAAFTVKRIREEHWYEMPIKAAVAATLAYAVRFVVGEIAGRGRPFVALEGVNQLVPMEAAYDSFPSGHAALAFALAFVVLKYDRDWGIAFLLLAILVALGRVFAGLHFPLDVAGGLAVGWFAAWAVHKVEHSQWSKLERALRVRN